MTCILCLLLWISYVNKCFVGQNHSHFLFCVKFRQLCSSSSAVWQTALRFIGDILVFEGINLKAARGGFWLALKALITLFPLFSLGAAFLTISAWWDQLTEPMRLACYSFSFLPFYVWTLQNLNLLMHKANCHITGFWPLWPQMGRLWCFIIHPTSTADIH